MWRICRLLTRRRLILANLALGVAFVLVAVDAACPLVKRPSSIVEAADRPAEAASSLVRAPVRVAMLDDYTRIMTINDIFARKALWPPPPPPPPPPQPPKDPNWTLVGLWEVQDGVWRAAIFDRAIRPRGQDVTVGEGARLRARDYGVIITEVTRDSVRFEIHPDAHTFVYQRTLTWSGIRAVDNGPEARR
ncbi:MAG: hypothetical protein JW889_00670 [Verrucomicrobia bacterium]|nr:hypothetical protein [Verrucomicrobiota bacterium]